MRDVIRWRLWRRRLGWAAIGTTGVCFHTRPTVQQLNAASLLASQSTFGMPFKIIESMAQRGHDDWIDAQFALPISRHTAVVNDLVARRNAGEFAAAEQNIEFLIFFRRFGWWHTTVTAEDVLRQRLAFALSEIFVVSDNVAALHPGMSEVQRLYADGELAIVANVGSLVELVAAAAVEAGAARLPLGLFPPCRSDCAMADGCAGSSHRSGLGRLAGGPVPGRKCRQWNFHEHLARWHQSVPEWQPDGGICHILGGRWRDQHQSLR
jgi:hypothetical protein